MRQLYPAQEHRSTVELSVGGGHTIVVHESGNPDGSPAIVVHGGPGGGSSPEQYRFFDPAVYRIVLVDQRGCGRSTPAASVEHNTTWDLVDDIEAVRVALGIDRWLVFGGSWGSALSLAYAQAHPERVRALVLRGIFLLRRSELRFFYQDGASHLFPDQWEHFVEPIPRPNATTSSRRTTGVSSATTWTSGHAVPERGPSGSAPPRGSIRPDRVTTRRRRWMRSPGSRTTTSPTAASSGARTSCSTASIGSVRSRQRSCRVATT